MCSLSELNDYFIAVFELATSTLSNLNLQLPECVATFSTWSNQVVQTKWPNGQTIYKSIQNNGVVERPQN